MDEKVYVKDFPSKKWVPGKVIEIRGPLSYLIQLSDGRVRRRHVDAVRSRSVAVSLEMDNSGVEIPLVEMTEMNESDDTEPTPIVSSEMLDSNNSEPSEPDIAPSSSSPVLEQPAPPVPSSRRTSSCHRAPPTRYGYSFWLSWYLLLFHHWFWFVFMSDSWLDIHHHIRLFMFFCVSCCSMRSFITP